MDFLKKGQEMLNKSGSGSTTGTTGNQAPATGTTTTGQPAAAGGSEDYGDKAMDFIQKKTGHTFTREQNEKMTDGARGLYEKQTGSKVNPKYSN